MCCNCKMVEDKCLKIVNWVVVGCIVVNVVIGNLKGSAFEKKSTLVKGNYFRKGKVLWSGEVLQKRKC